MGIPYAISVVFELPGERANHPGGVTFTRCVVFEVNDEAQRHEVRGLCLNPKWGHKFVASAPFEDMHRAADLMTDGMVKEVWSKIGCPGVMIPSDETLRVVVGRPFSPFAPDK